MFHILISYRVITVIIYICLYKYPPFNGSKLFRFVIILIQLSIIYLRENLNKE